MNTKAHQRGGRQTKTTWSEQRRLLFRPPMRLFAQSAEDDGRCEDLVAANCTEYGKVRSDSTSRKECDLKNSSRLLRRRQEQRQQNKEGRSKKAGQVTTFRKCPGLN